MAWIRAVCLVIAIVGCNSKAAGLQPDAAGGDAAVDVDAAPTAIGLDQRPANPTCKAFTPPPATGNVRLVSKFPNLHFNTPTGLFQRPGDNARWYVTERGGRVLSFPNDPNATDADVKVALDLRPVTWTQWDCSMSGVAFPPKFATSKHLYVAYCYSGPDTTNHLQVRISRFATADGGLTFDPASEQLILALDHPSDATHPNIGLHTSDAMRFGADGYLYASIGDGGPQGKGGGTQSQDTNDLRGKLLRLDVSDLTKQLSKDFVANRQRLAVDIPPDNPFVGGGGNPAIWAYGFRNPWQWHFDRADGSIWLGDVGNSTYEEVDRHVVKGGNYGWSAYEGFHCTGDFPATCLDPTVKMPLLDYTHGSGDQQGNAITGGIVYRGTGVPSLTGSYIFGDSSQAHIWAVRNVDALVDGVVPTKNLLFAGAPVSMFAEDQDGELYATILYNTGTYPVGTILGLEEAPPATPDPNAGPPALLSQTGCFEADAKTPLPALIPFEPGATLFSDGATKRRWFALPDGATIATAADGDFNFPVGSVMVKEFSLGEQRIETRFFVRQDSDGRWQGYSYKWRADGTDADLVTADGATEVVAASQTWTFPSRAQCHQCHTLVAGTTLGPELAQLDHAIQYPATGRTANQLDTLWAIGVLDNAGVTTSSIPSLVNLTDTTASVEDRARDYLHVNCSNCHRPDGPTFTPLDLRFQTSLHDAGICNQLPTIDDLTAYIPSNPLIMAPGSPDHSVLYERLKTTDANVRMPPIGRSLTDQRATQAIGEWITLTTACP